MTQVSFMPLQLKYHTLCTVPQSVLKMYANGFDSYQMYISIGIYFFDVLCASVEVGALRD